jgi:hypothetical protein
MLSTAEIQLFRGDESDRVERKQSASDLDRIIAKTQPSSSRGSPRLFLVVSAPMTLPALSNGSTNTSY